MTASSHAIAGAIVAATVNEPIIALPVAYLSHFLLDALPHFGTSATNQIKNKRFFTRLLVVDSTVALTLLISLPILLTTTVDWWLTLACIILACAPDVAWGWRWWQKKDLQKVTTGQMSWHNRFHKKIQWNETPRGGLVELAWAVCGLTFIAMQRV